jgi:Domain of unknown function (DUF4129)
MRTNGTPGPRRDGVVILGAALAAVAAIGLAAAAARQGVGVGNSREPTRILVPEIPPIFYYLVGVLEIVGLIGLIFLNVATRKRQEDEPGAASGTWWQRALALLLLLGLASLVVPPLSHLADRPPVARPGSGGVAPDAGPPPAIERVGSSALGIFFTLLLGLLVVGLVAALFFFFARGQEEPPSRRERSQDDLAKEVRAGIVDLASIRDPRRAVIACYARMQRLLPSAGITSRPADTPFELLARILEQRDVARSSVTTLTESFERAKFSSHSIGESTRAEALGALRNIRDQLGSDT